MFEHDMTRKGLVLAEDSAADSKTVSVAELEPIAFLREGEEQVSGATMRERAKKLNANHGQGQAEDILKNQEKIPKEWLGWRLVFPGTVWDDPNGKERYVFCLVFSKDMDCWRSFFDYLGNVYRPRDRFLRRRE